MNFPLYKQLKKYNKLTNKEKKKLNNYLLNFFFGILNEKDFLLDILELKNDDNEKKSFINEFLTMNVFNKLEVIFNKVNDENGLFNYLRKSFKYYCTQKIRHRESYKIWEKIKEILLKKCKYNDKIISNNTIFYCECEFIEEKPILKRRGKKQTYSLEDIEKYICYLYSNNYVDGITISNIMNNMQNDFGDFDKKPVPLKGKDEEDDLDKEQTIRDTNPTPEEEYYHKYYAKELVQWLNKEEIELLYMKLRDEKNLYEQAKQKFNCSLGTINNKLNRLFVKLKKFAEENEINNEDFLEILKKMKKYVLYIGKGEKED